MLLYLSCVLTLQYRYAFDMCRLGKHIQWLHRAQTVGRMKMAKNIQVSRQGGGIARDIHYPANRMSRKCIEHNLLTARTWWIDHQSIDPAFQCWQQVCHFPLTYCHIAHFT